MKVIPDEEDSLHTRSERGVFSLTDSFRWSNIHATVEKRRPERPDF